MKKKLVLILLLAVLLCSCSVAFTAFAAGDVALTITINTGVQKVVIKQGSKTGEITSTITLRNGQIYLGKSITFTVYYASGYCSYSGESSSTYTTTYYTSTASYSPTAYYALTLTLGTGIKNVVVNNKTYTSSTKFGVTPNSTVSYTVNCSDGYMLSGNVASGTTTYTGSMTMSSAKSLSFSGTLMPKLTVTVDEGISSYFVSHPAAGSYTGNRTFYYGSTTSVTWSVTAKSGYTVAGATGGTISVSSSTAKLNFTTTCKLTVTIGTGVAGVTVNGTTYTSNTSLQLATGSTVSWSATAATGYTLSQTSGSLTMSASQTLAPSATPIPYTITFTKNTGVKALLITSPATHYLTSSDSASIPYGSTVNWQLEAEEGYHINGQSGGSFTMTGNQTFNPTASLNVYKVNFYVDGAIAKSQNVTHGSSATTYTPTKVGHNFVGWYSDANCTTAYSFGAVKGATNIYAKFAPKVFIINLTYNPTNAQVFTNFSWKTEWVSGYAKTGSCSNYVELSVSADGKTATVKFKADFTGAKIRLTAYCTNAPTIKASVEITCG